MNDQLLPTPSLPSTGPDQAAPAPQVEGYQVVGKVGEGGMGCVWRAVQLSTKREVALKVIGAGSIGSRRAQLRFEREVELTARLDHPHVARVYDSGVHQGVYFYAAELIDGLPLDRYAAEKKLDERAILGLMRQICDAVQHAHQRGVIHRDLKPSNVLITPAGHEYVLDFGLAKTADTGADHHLTATTDGHLAGTPAYMSPEQAAGRTDLVDTRTDVYALGVILYRLLTGESPHDLSGGCAEILRRIGGTDARRPRSVRPQLHRDLEAVLLKALARTPEQRYQTVSELAADVDRYLRGDPVTAQHRTATYLLAKAVRKYWPQTAIAAVACALAVIAVTFHTARLREGRNVALAAQRSSEESRNAEARQRRLVDVRTAQSQVAYADLLAINGPLEPMPRMYEEAQALFVGAGASPRPAQIGLSLAYELHPPPLVGSEAMGDGIVSRIVLPDARTMLTATSGGVVLTHDIITGRELRPLSLALPGVRRLASSLDGHVVATLTREGEISLWDVATGTRLATVTDPELRFKPKQVDDGVMVLDVAGWITDALVAADRRTVFYAFRGAGLRVLDVVESAGKVSAGSLLVGPGEFSENLSNSRLALTRGGRQLVYASAEGYGVIDVATRTVVRRVRTRPGSSGGTSAVAASDDGRYVATADRSNDVLVWDGETDRLLRSLQGQGELVTVLAFSRGGDMLGFGGINRGAGFWKTSTGERVLSLDRTTAKQIVFSPDGRTVTLPSATGVAVYPLGGTREVVMRDATLPKSPLAVGFALGGRVVLVAPGNGEVAFDDVAAGGTLKTVAMPRCAGRFASFSGDGRLAACDEGDGLAVWDLFAGRKLWGARPIRGRVVSATFSRDSSKLVTCETFVEGGKKFWPSKGHLRLHECRTGGEIAITRDFPAGGRVFTGFLNARGDVVSGVMNQGSAKLWDGRTGAEIRELPWGSVHGLDVSEDGRVLIGDDRGRLTLHDQLLEGGAIGLASGAGEFAAVVLSADATLAITATADRFVHLYAVDPPREIRAVQLRGKAASSVALAPAGTAIATANVDGSVSVGDPSRATKHMGFARTVPDALARLSRDPNDVGALLVLADWYAFRREWPWAKEALELALKAGADVPEVLRGQVLRATGDAAGARAAFGRAASGAVGEERAYLELLAQ